METLIPKGKPIICTQKIDRMKSKELRNTTVY